MQKVFVDIVTPDGRKRFGITQMPITIGRHPDNAIQLADTKTSRHHCVIEVANNRFWLCDLESRNGVKLNGAEITKVKLRDGDRIELGYTTLSVHIVKKQVVTAPSPSSVTLRAQAPKVGPRESADVVFQAPDRGNPRVEVVDPYTDKVKLDDSVSQGFALQETRSGTVAI